MKSSKAADKSAALFVDDGGEDAYEFASNYIWFDPTNAEDTRRAWSEAQSLYFERMARLQKDAPFEIVPPRLAVGSAPTVEISPLLKSA